MLWHMVWLLVSFFAVLGLLSCIVGAVELLALRRVNAVRRTVFRVELAGEEPHVEYLLNTLSLMAEKLDVGRCETVLELVDQGVGPETKRGILEYCKKNPWVVFTDGADDDKIE